MVVSHARFAQPHEQKRPCRKLIISRQELRGPFFDDDVALIIKLRITFLLQPAVNRFQGNEQTDFRKATARGLREGIS
jgi:hypothetical protein